MIKTILLLNIAAARCSFMLLSGIVPWHHVLVVHEVVLSCVYQRLDLPQMPDSSFHRFSLVSFHLAQVFVAQMIQRGRGRGWRRHEGEHVMWGYDELRSRGRRQLVAIGSSWLLQHLRWHGRWWEKIGNCNKVIYSA